MIAFRTADDPAAGGRGRSHDGKILVAGAVECRPDGSPGRIRLQAISDFSGTTLKRFVEANTARGATAVTDGLASYRKLVERTHKPKVICAMAAHVLLPWIYRVFSNLKRLALGVYHGFRRAHVQAYLDEFVFRWNRRRHYRSAFDTLLGIGIRTGPVTYREVVSVCRNQGGSSI